MSIDFPEDALARMWEEVDWDAAEKKLAILQERLSIAAYRMDDKAIRDIQRRIVRDPDIKCLAVRHVVRTSVSPGVDRVKWKTPAEMIKAAFSLTSKDYKASPLRQILIVAKNTGKERRPQLPTYRDRAMSVLYGYSLIPVTEAWADSKSFAFRPGRSAQDAHEYIMEALKGSDAPEVIVCADVKSYYAHIQHSWLLKHAPMDKNVLYQLLNAGIVFEGELFPAEDVGISEGSNLSPYLGNFVLDGLQRFIYQGLHGTELPADYKSGYLVRFADDIMITVRTEEDAEKVLSLLRDFVAERGLTLSEEKTVVKTIDEGFTFMSRTYFRKRGIVYCVPSEKAVERIITELQELIANNKKSQRDMIQRINAKLKGWAGYHRYTDALDAFRRVDAAVQTALLEAAVQKHPKMALQKILNKYWYKESNGKHCYALPNDKSVRVIRLADTLLLTHHKVDTRKNPYIERDYTESRTHNREIENVTGRYRAIWERQNGRCYYCGRPILPDQPRTTVPLDIREPFSIRNSAYVHKKCVPNEFEVVRTMEDISVMRPYDMQSILESISEHDYFKTVKEPLTPDWPHFNLKKYFAKSKAASITMSFEQFEKIDGVKLPVAAYRSRQWWSPKKNVNKIAEAWLSEGFYLQNLDLARMKLTFHRASETRTHLVIPEVLTKGKLPDNAVFELETHMAYIIKKYGL